MSQDRHSSYITGMAPTTQATALACLDVTPCARIVTRDQAAAWFLKANPRFVRGQSQHYFTAQPTKRFSNALKAACKERPPRASILRVEGQKNAAPLQINILPFQPELIRIVLFLPRLMVDATPVALPKLTSRETSVLRLAASGQRRDRIAYELNISLPTVDMHCRNLRQKLSALTTSEAVAIATKMNLLDM
jgi:DNA-binding CsgD family transcriptional regulator